jgi:tellurite methyltransferase
MNYDSKYWWEDFYRWLEPHDIIKESVQFLSNRQSMVLDVGCWEGKDSFFLSKSGFDVTAIDISEVWISKVEKYCSENELSIKTKVSDALNYLKEDNCFDAIYAINILQFMNKNEVYTVIKEMQSNTIKNWLNIIAWFIPENEDQRIRIEEKWLYYFDEQELKWLYRDFRIIKYEEVLWDRETHGQPKHRHYMVKMIAQKV